MSVGRELQNEDDEIKLLADKFHKNSITASKVMDIAKTPEKLSKFYTFYAEIKYDGQSYNHIQKITLARLDFSSKYGDELKNKYSSVPSTSYARFYNPLNSNNSDTKNYHSLKPRTPKV